MEEELNRGPKVTFEFDWWNNKEELKQLMRSGDVEVALWEFSQELRQLWKYDDLKRFDDKFDVVEHIRERFYEILGETGIEL